MNLCVIILLFLNNSFQPNEETVKHIDSLNKLSFNLKDSDPFKSLAIANQSYTLSKKNNFQQGIAESYRMMGINFDNIGKSDSSIIFFHEAYEIFTRIKDSIGIAKSLNNLGNFYNKYDNYKAITYFTKAIKISQNKNLEELTAGCYLNIGAAYTKLLKYEEALSNLQKAHHYFNVINNNLGISLSLLNIGVTYSYKKDYKRAKENLIKSYSIAKKNNLKSVIGRVNQTLASVNIIDKKFDLAESLIKEGLDIAEEFNDDLLKNDYIYIQYSLEYTRGDFKKAIKFLQEVNKSDSIYFKNSTSDLLRLSEEKQTSLEKQKEYEVAKAKQKNTTVLFLASVVVIILSLILIFLLIKSKKKTEKTNQELLLLNQEVSQQKDNLDRINSRLEEIISDRTKDLISKNRKLSEYSSHLSHQVRGPVATLKGLIMLSQDNLIEEKECIAQMKKCVDDIDEQIMDINIALHDPDRKGLGKKN